MTNSEKAAEIYNSGFNCAQAVLSAYAKRYSINKEQVLMLASGFGAGMARMQETCGAVSGAFLVIGLAVGEQNNDFPLSNERSYLIILEFVKRFKEKNNSIKCLDLLNCNINTEEGIYIYDVNELHKKVCLKCVSDAAEILDELVK